MNGKNGKKGAVKQSKPERQRHIPQRTCVGCHEVLPKRSLIRVVNTTQGVRVDPGGKLSGRGAYLHNMKSCWEQGLRGALAHALKVDLTEEEYDSLKTFANTIPD